MNDSVTDIDGHFLLIEASQHIPNWLSPSNSENRPWIIQSLLHIIPLTPATPAEIPFIPPSDENGGISLKNAVSSTHLT
jgi:hypothetical protein